MSFKDNLFYYGFLLLEKVVFYTPKPLKNLFKKLLTEIFYRFDNKRKKVIKTNLKLAFGDSLSEEEKRRIVKKTYENFVNNLFEFIEVSKLTKDELKKKVSFKNEDLIKEKLKNSPVIITSAHFGNWEVALLAIGAFITPLSGVARDIDNPKLNQRIKKVREKFNVKIYNKKGVLKKLIKDLKNGRSVGILVDQNTARDEGVDTMFFDKKVLQTPSSALLSKRLNVPVVMAFCEKDGDKWVVNFKDAFVCEDVQKCVDRQSRIIEEEVRSFPELWYWFHRRFKHYYEEEYE